MYKGFKKIHSKDSPVFHLGTSWEKTICGEPVTKSFHVQEYEHENPPEGKRVCKKCRSSVITKLSK